MNYATTTNKKPEVSLLDNDAYNSFACFVLHRCHVISLASMSCICTIYNFQFIVEVMTYAQMGSKYFHFSSNFKKRTNMLVLRLIRKIHFMIRQWPSYSSFACHILFGGIDRKIASEVLVDYRHFSRKMVKW